MMNTITAPDAPARGRASVPALVATALGRLLRPGGTEACELLLVRHAQPDYRAAALSGSIWDPPLTTEGRAQAHRLAARLLSPPLDAVYASTMARAKETAAFIAQAHDLPLHERDDLREIDFDLGVAVDGVHSEDQAQELVRRFMSNPSWDALPGFEPARQFRHRVIQAVEAIVAAHPGQRVAVVAHGGVINAYLTMTLDIPRDMFFLPAHASISSVVVHDGLYALAGLNDTAHLPPEMTTH